MTIKGLRTGVSDHLTWFFLRPFLAVVLSRLAHVQRVLFSHCSSGLHLLFVLCNDGSTVTLLSFCRGFAAKVEWEACAPFIVQCVLSMLVNGNRSILRLNRSCIYLGHDVLGVNCVVFQHVFGRPWSYWEFVRSTSHCLPFVVSFFLSLPIVCFFQDPDL